MGKKAYSLCLEWGTQYIKVVAYFSDGIAGTSEVLGIYAIRDAFQDALKKSVDGCIAQHGKPQSTVVFLSRSNVLVRYLELPSLDTLELNNMVSLQIERHVPYALHEMNYDFVHSPSSKKDGYSHVVLAAVNAQSVTSVVTVLRDIGLAPDLVTVSSWGLVAQYWQSAIFPAHKDEYILLLDMDYAECSFVIMRGADVVFTRSIVCAQGGGGYEMAVDTLVRELRQSLHELERDYGSHFLQGVVVGKNGFSYEGLVPRLLPYAVPLYTIDLRVSFRNSTEYELAKENNMSFFSSATVLDVSEGNILDLLPAEEKKEVLFRQSGHMRKKTGLLFGICVFVLMVALGYHVFLRYAYIKNIENEILSIDPEAKRVADIVRKMHTINDMKRLQVIPLELLSELYRVVDPAIVLSDFEYDVSRGIVMHGVSDNMTHVSDLLIALQKTEYFKFAEIKYAKNKKEKGVVYVDFQITCPFSITDE